MMKEIEGNVVENLKKENCLLKNEKKDLSNENNKLKSMNEDFEIERKMSESERKQLYEDKKRFQEIVWFKTITSINSDETVNMKQKLEVFIEISNENNILNNKNKLLSYRVEKTSCTEKNFKTTTSLKKNGKKRKFKFFCF